MRPKGIFITGTDTGVGKTIVAAGIARYLHDRGIRVGVLKPVTSGALEADGRLVSEDAELLRWAARSTAPAGDTAPYVLRDPLAPSEAARRDGVAISRNRIREAFDRLAGRHDFLIVEGAGGLLVPLADDLLVADLAKHLELPLLIVARPDLGTAASACWESSSMDSRNSPVKQSHTLRDSSGIWPVSRFWPYFGAIRTRMKKES